MCYVPARRQRRRERSGRGQTARRFIVLESRPQWQVDLARAADSDVDEERLWAAVLADAVSALRWRHPEGRRADRDKGSEPPEALWREAVEWILSRELEPLGTFESVCGVLRLSADVVRRDLASLAILHAPRLEDDAGLTAVVSVAMLAAGGQVCR